MRQINTNQWFGNSFIQVHICPKVLESTTRYNTPLHEIQRAVIWILFVDALLEHGWFLIGSHAAAGLFWMQCTVTSLQSTAQCRKCGMKNSLERHQKPLAAFMGCAGWWMILQMPNDESLGLIIKKKQNHTFFSVSDFSRCFWRLNS